MLAPVAAPHRLPPAAFRSVAVGRRSGGSPRRWLAAFRRGVADVAGLAAAAAASTVMEPMSTESALSMESVARGGVLLPRSEPGHQLTYLLKQGISFAPAQARAAARAVAPAPARAAARAAALLRAAARVASRPALARAASSCSAGCPAPARVAARAAVPATRATAPASAATGAAAPARVASRSRCSGPASPAAQQRLSPGKPGEVEDVVI